LRVGDIDGIDETDDWFLPFDGVARRIRFIVVRCSRSGLGIDDILGVIVSVSQLVGVLAGWCVEISLKAGRGISLGMRVMGIGGENDLLDLERKTEHSESGRQIMAPITVTSAETLRP
jgi:hypothetical protein